MFLKLGPIEPRGSVSQCQRFGKGPMVHFVCLYNMRLCVKEMIYSFNYEGFGECMDRICGVQYLQ